MRIRVFLLLSLVLGLFRPALADVIYTYTGNDFTNAGSPFTPSDSVQGSLTLTTALGANLNYQSISPSSYSFSDGEDTIDNTTGPFPTFIFDTNSAGSITGWLIELTRANNSASIESFNMSGGYGSVQDYGGHNNGVGGVDIANNLNDAGTWAVTVSPPVSAAAPEPSSLMLLATGLAGGVQMIRRRRVA